MTLCIALQIILNRFYAFNLYALSILHYSINPNLPVLIDFRIAISKIFAVVPLVSRAY